mgnify:CR=1 FL=1
MFPTPISCYILTIFIIFLQNILYSNASSVPKLSEFNRKHSQSVESLFALTCVAIEGSNPLKFQWFKNDQQISSSGRIVLETEPTMSMLKIYSVQHSDSANYSCQAQNHAGIDLQSTILIVKGLIFLGFLINF